jgi:hypothetical protein
MLHVGCGYSLRETVVRARESRLADLSDVALLKRLRKCEQWLYTLAVGLWQQRGLAQLSTGKRIVRLIEGTGEGLRQIPVQKGEYLLADRGYCLLAF